MVLRAIGIYAISANKAIDILPHLGILCKFTKFIVQDAWGPSNRVFLRKYLIAALSFGKKPGFEESKNSPSCQASFSKI
ncbi:MAG TPA: hypothetical protein DCS91_09720 [Microcoleaceae bacterium UBA11344]|nr:hypothetical protein [Microcoleaceae cyanobacterium UBA11344]